MEPWSGYLTTTVGLAELTTHTVFTEGDVLRVEVELPVGALARLVAASRHDRLELPAQTHLDEASATALAVFSGDQIILPALVSLEPEAARALIAWRGAYLALGVSELPPASASVLDAWSGRFELIERRAALDPFATRHAGAAWARRRGHAWLWDTAWVLPGVVAVDEALARRLDGQPHIALPHVASLDPEGAARLMRLWRRRCPLELMLGVTSLSPEVARILVADETNDRHLALPRLTPRDVELARELARFEGEALMLAALPEGEARAHLSCVPAEVRTARGVEHGWRETRTDRAWFEASLAFARARDPRWLRVMTAWSYGGREGGVILDLHEGDAMNDAGRAALVAEIFARIGDGKLIADCLVYAQHAARDVTGCEDWWGDEEPLPEPDQLTFEPVGVNVRWFAKTPTDDEDWPDEAVVVFSPKGIAERVTSLHTIEVHFGPDWEPRDAELGH